VDPDVSGIGRSCRRVLDDRRPALWPALGDRLLDDSPAAERRRGPPRTAPLRLEQRQEGASPWVTMGRKSLPARALITPGGGSMVRFSIGNQGLIASDRGSFQGVRSRGNRNGSPRTIRAPDRARGVKGSRRCRLTGENVPGNPGSGQGPLRPPVGERGFRQLRARAAAREARRAQRDRPRFRRRRARVDVRTFVDVWPREREPQRSAAGRVPPGDAHRD